MGPLFAAPHSCSLCAQGRLCLACVLVRAWLPNAYTQHDQHDICDMFLLHVLSVL
jgi:hypothetical protein